MHGYARRNSVEGLARNTACRAAGQIGESGPPRFTDVRKGSPNGDGHHTICARCAGAGRPTELVRHPSCRWGTLWTTSAAALRPVTWIATVLWVWHADLDGRPVGEQPFLTDSAGREYPESPTLV